MQSPIIFPIPIQNWSCVDNLKLMAKSQRTAESHNGQNTGQV